jgi:hypothetical protein
LVGTSSFSQTTRSTHPKPHRPCLRGINPPPACSSPHCTCTGPSVLPRLCSPHTSLRRHLSPACGFPIPTCQPAFVVFFVLVPPGSLPSNRREQRSRDCLVRAALCNQATSRKPLSRLGAKGKVHISQSYLAPRGYSARLLLHFAAALLPFCQSHSIPTHLPICPSAHRALAAPGTASATLRCQCTQTTSTSRSAHPASAQIARDSTTGDKPARSPKQPLSKSVEISRRHSVPFGQLQEQPCKFQPDCASPGTDRSQQSLDSIRHLTTNVAAARNRGRLADQCLSVRPHRAIRDLWRREQAKRT